MSAVPTLGESLASFAEAATFPSLPDAVVDSVKMRVLDTLGICVAASTLPTSSAARAYAADQGGVGQAHAVGVDGSMPATFAGFVNGVLAHSLDYDDTHLPSVLHPSASVIPAALAAAEATGADGQATIAAIAAGLEVCVRTGMAGYDEASGTSVFFEHGQHATSICGTLGSAVAAAMLYGLDADGILHSLGLAGSMAAGLIESNRTGGTVKRMHCGWAAHAGISAAQLVVHGFTGPPTVLEGRFGFYQAWLHGQFDASAITGGLGELWTVPDIFFKPYPANHFTHTVIDAARALRQRGLVPDEVERIRVGVPASIVRTIGEPIEVKRTPETGYMAQFSGPYAVAAGLFGGGGLGVGLDDFTDELACHPDRRRLMSKVSVVANDECTGIFPHQFPAVVTAWTTSGQELVEKALTNRGGPQNPLTYDELATKFADNAGRLLSEAVVDAVRSTIATLDELPNLSALLTPLAVPLPNHER